ncbi:MAG: hypothetical protein KR126chlam2_01050 [Chlamydiae bacterium]|nr:hypothetical protein [Chlamydiota bacterium]
MSIKIQFQEKVRFEFDWEDKLDNLFNSSKSDLKKQLQLLNSINSRYNDVSALGRDKSPEMQKTVKAKMEKLMKVREQVIESLKEHCMHIENRYKGKELSEIELHDLVNSFVFHYALEEPLFAHVDNVDQAIYNLKEGDIHHERMCEFVEQKLKGFGVAKSMHEIKELIRASKCII